MTCSEVEVPRWTNELSCTFSCSATLLRLLSTAMSTSCAALGQKADAQIKLLEEYLGAQRYGAAPASGSTSGKFGAASDGVGSHPCASWSVGAISETHCNHPSAESAVLL